MILQRKPFDFIKPDNQEAAIAALEAHSPDVRVLAGGTDYLVELKHANKSPGTVVDVSQVSELKGIDEIDDGLRIGAGVTHTEIMADPLIKKYAPAMIDAAHTVGAVQTRNLGTLGGNLVTCVPSMDSGPTLVALEAEATVAEPRAGAWCCRRVDAGGRPVAGIGGGRATAAVGRLKCVHNRCPGQN